VSLVTRDMAHVRIPYRGVAIGKSLVLTTHEYEDAEVGIRQGAFWLDYKRVPLHKTVSLPLTGAYRHPDGSFDVMYFLPSDTEQMRIGPVEARIVPSFPRPRTLLRIVRDRTRTGIFRNMP
jgi:hypothetical protein